MVGSTDVYLVVPQCVAVIHLQSFRGPETEDTHREATSQSYQGSQIRHFLTKKGNVLHHWHCLLGHSIKHIESWLVFFLREEKRRKLRNKHYLGVETRENILEGGSECL